MTEEKTLLTARTITSNRVKDRDGLDVGKIKELMVNRNDGSIEYVAFVFSKTPLGLKEKYFALPWEALNLSEDQECFVLDVSKAFLENHKGFDKNNWPEVADSSFSRGFDEQLTASS